MQLVPTCITCPLTPCRYVTLLYLRSTGRTGLNMTIGGAATGLVLRNASAIRMPGTRYNYEDVRIIKGDIKAGDAVVHITDLP